MLGGYQTSFTLTKNLESQNQIKHIDVIHYHICELVKDKKLEIKRILSSKMLADGLIKALSIGF